jgi:hypothetical protein
VGGGALCGHSTSVAIPHFLSGTPLRLAPASPTSSLVSWKEVLYALSPFVAFWCVLGHVAVSECPSPQARALTMEVRSNDRNSA